MRAGRWLAAHTPKDAVVATHNIGAIAFYSQRRIVDITGLVTPEVVPHILKPDYIPFLERLFAARHVTYLAVLQEWQAVDNQTPLFEADPNPEVLDIYDWRPGTTHLVAQPVYGSELRALAALQSGRYEEAMGYVRALLAADDRAATVWSLYGAVLDRSGHPAEAEPAFRRALALFPGSAEAHFGLGAALANLGRRPKRGPSSTACGQSSRGTPGSPGWSSGSARSAEALAIPARARAVTARNRPCAARPAGRQLGARDGHGARVRPGFHEQPHGGRAGSASKWMTGRLVMRVHVGLDRVRASAASGLFLRGVRRVLGARDPRHRIEAVPLQKPPSGPRRVEQQSVLDLQIWLLALEHLVLPELGVHVVRPEDEARVRGDGQPHAVDEPVEGHEEVHALLPGPKPRDPEHEARDTEQHGPPREPRVGRGGAPRERAREEASGPRGRAPLGGGSRTRGRGRRS